MLQTRVKLTFKRCKALLPSLLPLCVHVADPLPYNTKAALNSTKDSVVLTRPVACQLQTHLALQGLIYNRTATHLVQVTYEAYGAGGTGFIMECLTDNLNRSASEVRSAVQKAGGKMADPGSVMFNFQRQGQVFVSSEASEDQVISHKLPLVHSFLRPCPCLFLLTLLVYIRSLSLGELSAPCTCFSGAQQRSAIYAQLHTSLRHVRW